MWRKEDRAPGSRLESDQAPQLGIAGMGPERLGAGPAEDTNGGELGTRSPPLGFSGSQPVKVIEANLIQTFTRLDGAPPR
jgi:hypothetical protein